MKICAVDFLPARSDKSLEPRVLNSAEGRDFIDLIKAHSKELGTVFAETEDSLRVVLDASRIKTSKTA